MFPRFPRSMLYQVPSVRAFASHCLRRCCVKRVGSRGPLVFLDKKDKDDDEEEEDEASPSYEVNGGV